MKQRSYADRYVGMPRHHVAKKAARTRLCVYIGINGAAYAIKHRVISAISGGRNRQQLVSSGGDSEKRCIHDEGVKAAWRNRGMAASAAYQSGRKAARPQ